MFESVLLPAPFSPSSACTSPSAASESTRAFASTPGKRFVIPWSATAAREGAAVAVVFVSSTIQPAALPRLSLGASDHALHEPVHRIEVLHRQLLALRDPELAALVVERAGELVERAVDERLPLGGDLRLGGRAHLWAIRRDVGEAVLDRAVVETRLPRAVHRSPHPLRVVAAPVVDRGGEPRGRRELLGVRVVPDPRDPLRLRVLSGRRAVDVLPEHVGAGGDEALGRLLLLVGRQPRVP